MQYYMDGFRPGNPDIKDAASRRRPTVGAYRPLPEKVDVLIAGCGPAGLCLAAQLSQFPQFDTIIVEPKPGPIQKGQADGINTRSMEMFQAFGFADLVKRESYWVNQTAFWMPDLDKPGQIKRVGRVQDVADDSSEMPHTLMNQARVHELFLNVMRNSPTRLEPDYGWAVKDLTIDNSVNDYPVTVTLENTGVNAGDTKTVRANYVVGCDGARSTVRKSIGGELHGDAAHQAWGVMDILCNTDFPDIRQKCLVANATEGNVLILPREGGYLVRMYAELDKLNEDERVANRNLTIDHLVGATNRIMRPYTIDVKQVVWWSIYEIGHRLTDRFDDVPADETETRNPRVFTAGDACHTHSPKAGQGMNVSMGDTFNLGWKLAHVLTGRADPSLLRTYSAERWVEAKRLIDTDHEWSRIMSAPPGESELDGKDMPRIQSHFIANLEFTGGLSVKYDPSRLTGEGTHQALAAGQMIGKRFHSAPVVRLADAMQMELGHIAEADARWRLYAFAGKADSTAPGSAIHKLADWLERDPASPVVKYTRRDEDVDGLIDVRAVYQQTFEELAFEDAPAFLKPQKGKLGIMDFEKIFCVDHKGRGDFFDMRGIDRDKGCLIIVRPDQYVAHVLPLDAYQELSDFFAGIFSAGGRVTIRSYNLAAKQEIDQLITDWGIARDCGDWALLADCFQPDATIHISWFSGPAAEFIERSKKMLSEFKPGEVGKHLFGRSRIRVNGNRAVSESHVELHRRVIADPFDFDTTSWGRFYDHLELREDEVWRIAKRTMVYEKDRLDPVNPDDVPENYFAAMDLDRFPPACRFLCYRLGLNGRAPMDDIVQIHTPAEDALEDRDRGVALAAGSGPHAIVE